MISGCKKNDSFLFDEPVNIIEKKFTFPPSFAEIKSTKILIIKNYTGCDCELKDFSSWATIKSTVEENYPNVVFEVVILNLIGENKDSIISKIPVFKENIMIDDSLWFARNNILSNNANLNTYILNKHNRVKYIGNPILRKKEYLTFINELKKYE